LRKPIIIIAIGRGIRNFYIPDASAYCYENFGIVLSVGGAVLGVPPVRPKYMDMIWHGDIFACLRRLGYGQRTETQNGVVYIIEQALCRYSAMAVWRMSSAVCSVSAGIWPGAEGSPAVPKVSAEPKASPASRETAPRGDMAIVTTGRVA
jgi:hypothetical protein